MAFRHDRTSRSFLVLLTIGIFGLQSSLAVATSKGSPFLLSLGLEKPLISLIWTAGPIAGALAQPYFGVLSDQSRNPWGKRRPFIVCGAALMAPSLVSLAWVREMSLGLAWLFRMDPEGIWMDFLLKCLVIITIWTYFFAFQIAQVGFRALIVDSCPPHLLDQAMVWATRWNCLGNLVFYGAGFLDLPSALPWLDASQLQILVLCAALVIVFTTVAVCWVVEEDNPEALISRHALKGHKVGVIAVFKEVFLNIRRLSPNVSTIFQVQFFAWAGWFLFNYYITTYVGAVHNREETKRVTGQPPRVLLDETATRYSSLALLLSATVTLATTVLGPLSIAYARLSSSRLPLVTLRNLWFVAQVIFAASMLSTFLPVRFLHTSAGTTVLVSLIGMPWALTTWAPYSLIGEEINILNTSSEMLDDGDDEKLHETEYLKGSGTVMSLYITAINIPQLLATLTSSLIFWISDNNDVSLNGLEIVLKLSGVAAAAAAWRILAVVDRSR